MGRRLAYERRLSGRKDAACRMVYVRVSLGSITQTILRASKTAAFSGLAEQLLLIWDRLPLEFQGNSLEVDRSDRQLHDEVPEDRIKDLISLVTSPTLEIYRIKSRARKYMGLTAVLQTQPHIFWESPTQAILPCPIQEQYLSLPERGTR